MSASPAYPVPAPTDGRGTELERPVDVKTAARFLGVGASLAVITRSVGTRGYTHFRSIG